MPRAETPLRDAAPVAYVIGDPVAVGAVTTPVEAIVEEATPAEEEEARTAVEDGQA